MNLKINKYPTGNNDSLVTNFAALQVELAMKIYDQKISFQNLKLATKLDLCHVITV